tara:strand:- start:592 stop:1539 length:948 start_codon:yes stop_codon:yes gene_type:complete
MSEPFIKDFKLPILAILGFPRSGKAMLMNILSTFQKIEKVNTNILLEEICHLHNIKKIKTNVAKYLLRKNLNILFYNNSIGRDLNFKKNDFSSIYKYHNPALYIKRSMSSSEGKNNLLLENYYQMMFHESGNSLKFILNSVPSIKMIEIIKNPIEITYSWIKKDYGNINYSSPVVNQTTINYKKNILPSFVFGREKKHLKLDKFDKVASIVIHLFSERFKNTKKINTNSKKRLLSIYFDDLLINPKAEINKISIFLKRKLTKNTSKVLKIEKLPRDNLVINLTNKKLFLKRNISKSLYNKILQLEKKYLLEHSKK